MATIDTERKLFEACRRMGVSVTSPIHLSYRLDLPEGMSLVEFVRRLSNSVGAELWEEPSKQSAACV
jgi:hypothetical protein